MTAPLLTITVYGLPGPQGSKKLVGRGVMVESSKQVKPWREAVKTAALAALDARSVHIYGGIGQTALLMLREPVGASMVFTFARPKGHYRTGRNAHLLRDAAPRYPAVYPDLSKILRSTEDALTDAGVWADDARVVRYRELAKVYAGDPREPDALHIPGCVIRLWPITEGPADE